MPPCPTPGTRWKRGAGLVPAGAECLAALAEDRASAFLCNSSAQPTYGRAVAGVLYFFVKRGRKAKNPYWACDFTVRSRAGESCTHFSCTDRGRYKVDLRSALCGVG